jgi:hypothetical protein
MTFSLPYFDRCFLEGSKPTLDKTQKLLIGFSVRNRSFNGDFFRRAEKLAENFFSGLLIVVVDTPYAYNEAAHRGLAFPDENEISKALKIGDERFRMLETIFGMQRYTNLEIKRWEAYTKLPEVELLRLEICAASSNYSSVQLALTEYAQLWTGEIAEEEADLFHGFLLEEFPVFIYLYYRLDYLCDLYPGPNFSFFRRLESGEWKSELPTASIMSERKRLSFLNVGYPFSSV